MNGVWAYRRVGVPACGRIGVWAYRRVGVSANGRVGEWACGRAWVWNTSELSGPGGIEAYNCHGFGDEDSGDI
jgi:hypothetical protein